MDHLLQPRHPVRPHLAVPFLSFTEPGNEPYDNGEITTYIDRLYGWNLRDILHPSQSSKSQIDLASVLQAWLFFGLLRQIFGDDVDQLTFVTRAEDGQQYITTAPLWRLWDDYAGKIVDEEREDRNAHVDRTIQLAAGIVGEIHIELEDVSRTLDLVCLSIMLLCDTCKLVLSPNTEYLPSGQWPLSDGLLERIMKADGWCHSDIARLLQQLDLASLYFVSMMEPRDVGKHDVCDERRCSAGDVAATGYKRAHHDCKGCRDRIADELKIFEILETDSIPLLETRQDHEAHSIRLASSGSVREYIAISHVWSDGLGNQDQNAILDCQLRWLQNLVQKLPGGSLPIWLDTISCPVDKDNMSERAIEAYAKALGSMRKTYADASKVLVLDHSLLTVESAGRSALELLLRISTCGWTRRLWTYQEGILAQVLLFQFNDKAVNFDDLFEDFQHDPWAVYYPGLRNFRNEIRIKKYRPSDTNHRNILQRVSYALKYRKTSVPDDEALCLATVTALTPHIVEEIAKTTGEERMRILYSNLSPISRDLAFWYGRRMTIPGFGWAPMSFLNSGNETFANVGEGPDLRLEEVNQLARVSPDGLEFQAPGILLGEFKAHLQSFLVTTERGLWYHVTCRQSDDQGRRAIRLTPMSTAETAVDEKLSLVLLTQGPLHADFNMPGFEARHGLVGAFSGTSLSSDRATTVKLLCSAFILRKMNIDTEFPRVLRTYRFFRSCFEALRNAPSEQQMKPGNAEDIELLDDDGLMHDFRERGVQTFSDVVRGQYDANCASSLWAGTSMLGRRMSLTREGVHSIFDGVEIPMTQTWCMD